MEGNANGGSLGELSPGLAQPMDQLEPLAYLSTVAHAFETPLQLLTKPSPKRFRVCHLPWEPDDADAGDFRRETESHLMEFGTEWAGYDAQRLLDFYVQQLRVQNAPHSLVQVPPAGRLSDGEIIQGIKVVEPDGSERDYMVVAVIIDEWLTLLDH